MQILIFEDATCVLKICMIVAPGFVGNLLWKWIHSAANRNETSSTLLTKSFCVVSLASIVLHHLCHKRKMHKNAREIQQCLLAVFPSDVSKDCSFYFHIRFIFYLFNKEKSLNIS
jgi:hypothetical protein